MKYKTIILEKNEAGILKITLNRPHVLNALSMEMIEELSMAIMEAGKDKEVKALVITGAGEAFSAGADLFHLKKDKNFVKDGCPRAQGMAKSILTLEKPVIAAVNGVATAGGCELAIACDIRIASEKARFGELFIRIGLVPAMIGVYLLPKLIGLAKAKEFIFTGDIIDAKEAERIGMVNRVVPADKLEDVAMKLALNLARGPVLAIGKAKSAINKGLESSMDETLYNVMDLQFGLCRTDDHLEGVSAFLEKRKPLFKGK